MRVVFMGTPDFALPSLRALVENQYRVAAVVTRPDRAGGRGKKLRQPPVKVYAARAGITVLQPEKAGHQDFIGILKELEPDVVVVAAFGQILPAAVLRLPPYGCINVHASLLPAYRGAAPIHRAVINGETQTGVTIMQMDSGLDTGDIIIQKKVPINPDDTTGMVHDRLAESGGKLVIEALDMLAAGKADPVPQNQNLSSYASMLTLEDEIISWQQDALSIKNQVRGLNPWPGARTTMRDKLVKIWRVSVVERDDAKPGSEPGRVLGAGARDGIIVQAGRGVVSIEELQIQGKSRMSAAAFMRGNNLIHGTVLGH